MLAMSQQQALTLLYVANKTRNCIDIHGIRHVACESHDDSNISVMAFTGEGERTINIDGNARDRR